MMVLFQKYFTFYTATLILWGFLMAFLYNIAKNSSHRYPDSDNTLTWISLTIFLTYMFSDPLINLNFGYNFLNTHFAYLVWASFNVLTLVIIWLIIRHKNTSEQPAIIYVICGLIVNIGFFLGMFYDTYYGEYIGNWWFWEMYSITVNLSDMIMITALMLNKDFLGLVKVYTYFCKPKP